MFSNPTLVLTAFISLAWCLLRFLRRRLTITVIASIISSVQLVPSLAANPRIPTVGSREALLGFALTGVNSRCATEFVREAPAAWQRLELNLKGFQVNVSVDEQWEAGRFNEKRKRTDNWTICVPPEPKHMLVSDNFLMGADAANEKYSFRVQRASKDSEFMLRRVEPWFSKRLFGRLAFTHEFLNYARRIWWVPCDYVVDNLADNGFEIIHAGYGQERFGQNVAQIAVRYNGQLRTDPNCHPGAVYWAEFLPEQNWIVVRSGVTGIKSGNEELRIRVESTYQSWFGGEAFPDEIVLAYEDTVRDRIVEVRHISFDQPRANQCSVAQCYLPYYGISEAVVPREGRLSRIVLFINLAALLFMIAAFLLHRYGKRFALGD